MKLIEKLNFFYLPQGVIKFLKILLYVSFFVSVIIGTAFLAVMHFYILSIIFIILGITGIIWILETV